jgi:hypothetical protein
MYARNVTEAQLTQAAAITGLNIEVRQDSNRNRLTFNLKLNPNLPERFRSLKPNPLNDKWRRGSTPCYHGVWWFLNYLFEIEPNASVESNWYGRVVYTKDDWLDLAEEIGNMRLGLPGNIYYPYMVRDKCNCEREKLPPAKIVKESHI